jgi:hypothetical protein
MILRKFMKFCKYVLRGFDKRVYCGAHLTDELRQKAAQAMSEAALLRKQNQKLKVLAQQQDLLNTISKAQKSDVQTAAMITGVKIFAPDIYNQIADMLPGNTPRVKLPDDLDLNLDNSTQLNTPLLRNPTPASAGDSLGLSAEEVRQLIPKQYQDMAKNAKPEQLCAMLKRANIPVTAQIAEKIQRCL